MYSYINKNFSKAIFSENSNLISMWAAKRARFLYTLPSRIVEGRNLIDKLISEKKRFIVFHNDLPSLEELLPNKVISTKNSKHNDKLYNSFQSKEINEIGSFRILAQGANLVDLDAIIILSYYSSEDKLEQLVGRLRENGKLNDVYIVVYTDTQEKKWFDKATVNINNN
jgi:superfamily II DNA or RNA helicase